MFFFIPSNENGVIVDPYAAANIQAAADPGLRDVFIYSHGWWTSALDTMISYNRFTAGLCPWLRCENSLAIGIHWPSMLSENEHDWLNFAEGSSFFTMEMRAEHVGRQGICNLLRLILNCRPPERRNNLRIHLLGHSFGCKVICAALSEIIEKSPSSLYEATDFELVLLQPAIEDNALAPGSRYGGLAVLPRLRMLVTRSSQDEALCVHFKRAHAVEFFDREDRTALGAVGPSQETVVSFGGACDVNLASCSQASFTAERRLVVADLSAIHQKRATEAAYKPRPFAGQHSDIYFAEIYQLIAGFCNQWAAT